MKGRYDKSEALLELALQVTPLGSQTFSKSHMQFPKNVSPLFIDRGNGSRVWDIDNNEYLDCVNSLLAVSLGYCDPDVDRAVLEQLKKGVTFSLSHEMEYKVAKKITEIIPCAEMVRFGKNGTDATSGAIRVARAATGKEHILVCGYHGWQDWYIGSTTKDKGVPASTKNMTHHFQYNNIDSLAKLFEQYKNQVAAVIMEPMNISFPQENFLKQVCELTHLNNSLFIFDETITGFRFAKGGAQEYFGVIPDLATFGKGLGNGFPISILAGKKKYLELLSDVFISSTFGGETLSLAASYAVLEKHDKYPVIEHLHHIGTSIMEGIEKLIKSHELEPYLKITGHPSWSFLLFNDSEECAGLELKTLWMQEIFARGVLCLGTHNISYAYKQSDVQFLLNVYDEVFSIIKDALKKREVVTRLKCKPLQVLFKVR